MSPHLLTSALHAVLHYQVTSVFFNPFLSHKSCCYVAQRASVAQSKPAKWNVFVTDTDAVPVHVPWPAHRAGSTRVCLCSSIYRLHKKELRSTIPIISLNINRAALKGWERPVLWRQSLSALLTVIYQMVPKFLCTPNEIFAGRAPGRTRSSHCPAVPSDRAV